MRLVMAFAAGLVALPALAQEAKHPPLAADETFVQLTGEGEVVTQADRVTLGCTVSEKADTREAADSAALKKREAVIAALKKKGIGQEAIRMPLGPDGPAEMAGGAMLAALAAEEVEDELPSQKRFSIRLASVGRVAELSELMRKEGCKAISGPQLALSDKKAAVRKARDLAFTDARALAEAYAGKLNLSVRRIQRISEAGAIYDSPELGIAASRAAMMGMDIDDDGSEKPGEVTTRFTVSVDFVLGPK